MDFVRMMRGGRRVWSQSVVASQVGGARRICDRKLRGRDSVRVVEVESDCKIFYQNFKCKILWWAFFATLGQAVSCHVTTQWFWGRKVEIGLTTTHPKPACAQIRTPLMGLWTRVHSKGCCYKKVMADMCNMTKIRRIWLLLARKQKS